MKKPVISILTPTYNRAHVLHRVYGSLKRQRTRDFEWIVVDDGSTDDTPTMLERWQAEADFPISWYRYENNRGRNAAVNSGAKLVSGDYMMILDSDDELLNDALETFAHWRERTEIDAIPSVSRLYFRCVDESGTLIGKLEKSGATALPKEAMQISEREGRYRFGMTFEFIDVMKTAISGERRFVELTSSEHGPEIITHMEIAKQYETIYVDHPIRRYYTDDGEKRLSDKETGHDKMAAGKLSMGARGFERRHRIPLVFSRSVPERSSKDRPARSAYRPSAACPTARSRPVAGAAALGGMHSRRSRRVSTGPPARPKPRRTPIPT